MRVRVAGDLGLHVVEHDAPHLRAGRLQVGLGPLEHEASDLARLVDEDHAVDLRRDDRGVGDGEHGRRIDQDDVVVFADLGEELGHRGRRQQLRRVGRDGTGLEDVQIVEARRGHDVFHLEPAHQDVGDRADAVPPARVPDQDVGQSGLALDPEEPVDARAPQVGADEQRALTVLGHRERQVHDGGRLAFLEGGAGDDEDLALLLQARELDVRAQGAVGLGHRRLGIEVRDEERVALKRLRIHVGQRRPSLDQALHRLTRVDVGHDTEHGHLQIRLDVLDGPDGRVERLLHEGQDEAEHEADQPTDHDRIERLAADRRARLGGGPDDADLLHAFRFLDQRFLVLRLEQGEEVVVDLRVALQPLQAELDGRHLTVLLEELAHLTVEDLLATAQQGDLGVDLAPHLAAHLA